MKRCPYCGKEYADDVMHCATDNEFLVGTNPESRLASERTESMDAESAYLTYPDYQWTARDAWKCLGMILVFEVVLEIGVTGFSLHFPILRAWLDSGFGYFSLSIFCSTAFLLTAAYFARTETLNTFWNGFGLDRKPSDYFWIGIVAALVLRFVSHFILIKGWARGVSRL